MINIKSIIAFVVLGVLLAGLGGLCYYQWDAKRKTAALLELKNKELMEANLEIGRAHTQIVNEKQAHDKAMMEMDQKIKDEIKKRQALVTLYAELEAKYNTAVQTMAAQATTIEELKNATTIAELTPGVLFYKRTDGRLAEVKKLSTKQGDFRIDIETDTIPDGLNPDQTIKLRGEVRYKLHQGFKAKFIETKVPGGAINHYAELYELDDKGNVVGQLKLTEFDVIKSEDLLKKRWYWWNPKLDLFAGATIAARKSPKAAFTADLGISLSSIGVTKDDTTWRFFRLGVGYTEKNVSLSFSPAMYNLGKNLPLVSNVWIIPYTGYSFGLKAAMVGLGVGVVF